jgi:hypothetical protein
VIILACRIYDKVRLKLLQDRQYKVVDDIKQALVSCAWLQWYIDSAGKGARTAQFVGKTRARVQSPAVLVEGNKEHIRIVPEYILGSVTVVHVRIDYGNPLYPVAVAQVLDHDSFVVDITEPTITVYHPHGMVAGRSYQRKPVFNMSCNYLVSQQHGRAGCNQMCLGSLGFNPRDAEVGSCNIMYRSQGRCEFSYLGQVDDAFFKNLVPGI